MKIKLTCALVPLLLSLMGSKMYAQSPVYQWTSTFQSGYAVPYSMAIDGSGDIYIAGIFSDTVDFDPGAGTANLIANGQTDIFICKLNASGGYIWAKSIGGSGVEYPASIAVDGHGSLYVAGVFRDTVDFDPGPGSAIRTVIPGHTSQFVWKINSNGDYVWDKTFDGFLDFYDVTVDNAGNVYTAGSFQKIVDFDPGTAIANFTSARANAFINKLDSNGVYAWTKVLGGSGLSYPSGITVDAKGNIYTTGSFDGLIDFDPGAGFDTFRASAGDAFISKLNTNGAWVWTKVFGEAGNAGGNRITIDKSGNVLTVGMFSDSTDFNAGTAVAKLFAHKSGVGDMYVSKLDSNGNFIWAKGIGGGFKQRVYGLTLDANSDVYISGYFADTVDFDPGPGYVRLTSTGAEDAFVSKLDANGNYVWAKAIGGPGHDECIGIKLDGTGNIYTTGYFDSTVDFDPGSGTANFTSVGLSVYVSKWANSISSDVSRGNLIPGTTSIVPQPASGSMYVRCSDAGLYGKEATVYSMQGALVARFQIASSVVVDVSNWAPGVYSVRLPDGQALRVEVL
jgi:hypothetical protein